MAQSKRVLIVGGGFGGVTAALELSKKQSLHLDITLVSERADLQYYGVLYRLIVGARTGVASLPLKRILEQTRVHIVQDRIRSVDTKAQSAKGQNDTYEYDYLILAPGSEPTYFGIPGMEEHSRTFHTVEQALALKNMVQDTIKQLEKGTDTITIAVIGGGPTGVEAAGEILPYSAELCREHGLDPSRVSVVLVEAAARLLPALEERASAKVRAHLEQLGVRVECEQAVAHTAKDGIRFANGDTLQCNMIVWTAGVRASSLLESVTGLTCNKRGRAAVDSTLRAKEIDNVWLLGDAADTPYAGMAQTAVHDGVFAAEVIERLERQSPLPTYTPTLPAYAIPAGPWWAAVRFGPLHVFGWPGYVMRRLADLHVYHLILPLHKVPLAYLGRLS